MDHRLDLAVHGQNKRWERFAITMSPRRAKELLRLIDLLNALIDKRGFLSVEMRFCVHEGEWFVRVPHSKDLVRDEEPLTTLVVRVAEVSWRTYANEDPHKFASSEPVSEEQLKRVAAGGATVVSQEAACVVQRPPSKAPSRPCGNGRWGTISGLVRWLARK